MNLDVNKTLEDFRNIEENCNKSDSELARQFIELNPEDDLSDLTHNALRKRFRRIRIKEEELNSQIRTETPLESNKSSTVDKIPYKEDKMSARHPETGNLMSIPEFCEYHKIPEGFVKSFKLVTHTGDPYYNISSPDIRSTSDSLTSDFIEECVKKHIQPIYRDPVKLKSSHTFDRLIFSDVHIGMTPNPKGNSMFPDMKWNKDVLMKRMGIMANYCVENRKSNSIYVDMLGDFIDGFNSSTVRGGHSLPQDMDNKEMFDVGVEFMVSLIDILASEYEYVKIHLICNDNHSGSFGYTVNRTIQEIVKYRYPNNASVELVKEFIGDYKVDNHTFILSHGKDEEHMKFGMKPHLDQKSYDIVNSYSLENGLYDKNTYLHFSKGDSHVNIVDNSNAYFSYTSYPAFCVASGFIQNNYGKSRSGFTFETYQGIVNNHTSSTYWF